MKMPLKFCENHVVFLHGNVVKTVNFMNKIRCFKYFMKGRSGFQETVGEGNFLYLNENAESFQSILIFSSLQM